MSLDSKIIDLETKLAFQDKAIEELSESLFKLDKKQAALEQLCHSLQKKLHNFSQASGLDVGEHDDKPPHY